MPSKNCKHLGALGSKQSWDYTIGSFFTVIRRGNFVRKPAQLGLFTTYARTDKKTLRVLLSLLGHPDIQLVFKNFDGITTAYIGVPHDTRLWAHRLDATKEEMNLLLLGYPPWYKHSLPLSHNRSVPHPIKNASDILRGGWIIAVGFSKVDRVASNFMSFRDGLRVSGTLCFVAVEQAFVRLLHGLGKLTKAFPNDQDVRIAFSLMDDVLHLLRKAESASYPPTKELTRLSNRRNMSDMYAMYINSELCSNLGDWFHPDTWRGEVDFTIGLTDGQVITAMEVFNRYDPLSKNEINILEPVVQSVILGALAGVYHVCDSLTPVSSEDYLPELMGDGFIYLRERWPNYED